MIPRQTDFVEVSLGALDLGNANKNHRKISIRVSNAEPDFRLVSVKQLEKGMEKSRQ